MIPPRLVAFAGCIEGLKTTVLSEEKAKFTVAARGDHHTQAEVANRTPIQHTWLGLLTASAVNGAPETPASEVVGRKAEPQITTFRADRKPVRRVQCAPVALPGLEVNLRPEPV
jgi:hypothetical protein